MPRVPRVIAKLARQSAAIVMAGVLLAGFQLVRPATGWADRVAGALAYAQIGRAHV